MPGEKSGYNPGEKMADEFNEDSRELTPEEQAREKELAKERMDRLAKRAAEKKSEEIQIDLNEDNSASADAPNVPKLGRVKENRSKISLGTGITRRAKEAGRYSAATGRSEEGQETNHNRAIKNILNKFVFGGSFKLRTSQEKGKFSLRVLSGPEGHKDSRTIVKAEGTMEDIKEKLEKYLNHNYTKK